MRSKLYNFMVSVWNRVKGFKNMFQRVKQHPTLKKTPNAKIQPVYQQVEDDKQLAKDFNKAKAGTVLDKTWLGCKPGKGGLIKFSYHFQFEFPNGSKSGKTGRQAVYQSIDLPIGSTKSEVIAAIKGQIDDWLSAHYETSGKGLGRTSIGMDLIVSC